MATRYRIVFDTDQSTTAARLLAEAVAARIISIDRDHDGRAHALAIMELPDENVGRLAEMCHGDPSVLVHGKHPG